MNYISDSFVAPVYQVFHSIHQCGRSWIMASGSDDGVLSLSVFGSEGNRYSILVIEKEHLNSDYAGRDGKWLLTEKKESKHRISFNLEWAVEAAGSGCMVLCGRETHLPFNSSA